MTAKTFTADIKRSKGKIAIEIDAERFERLAAVFGMFNPDFLVSIERAESDLRSGRIRRIRSLKELRRA